MNKRTIVRSALAFLSALFLSIPADAQLFRAYLAPSPAGNDANPCTLPLPCRLLPAALAAVADGGEIWMLDSGNYNTATVNIAKSVTILAVPGALGSVVAAGGPAINIATAGVKVALRNLVIVPLAGAGGTTGIMMTNGSSLGVEHTLLAGLPSHGIYVATAARVQIADSVILNVGSSAVNLSGGATTEIVGTRIKGAADFGVATSSVTAAVATTTSITDSTISSASNCGLFSYISTGTAIAKSFLTRVTVTGNNAGACVQGGANAVMTLANSTFQGNSLGLVFTTPGSIFKSFGNNVISDNGIDVAGGTITTAALQ